MTGHIDARPNERPGVGHLALAMDVLRLGIVEAMEGDESAEKWLGSRAFDFWCDWADMNPDWLRRNVQRQMAQGIRGYGRASEYTDADIDRAVEMYMRGTSIFSISRRFSVGPAKVRGWLAERIGYRRPQETA